MLRKRSKVLKPIAITKYMMIGVTDLSPAPAMARITSRRVVISTPETAVPTVYFETTYF